jgi:hypothetical protein
VDRIYTLSDLIPKKLKEKDLVFGQPGTMHKQTRRLVNSDIMIILEKNRKWGEPRIGHD